jgi:hypothetical protein
MRNRSGCFIRHLDQTRTEDRRFLPRYRRAGTRQELADIRREQQRDEAAEQWEPGAPAAEAGRGY